MFETVLVKLPFSVPLCFFKDFLSIPRFLSYSLTNTQCLFQKKLTLDTNFCLYLYKINFVSSLFHVNTNIISDNDKGTKPFIISMKLNFVSIVSTPLTISFKHTNIS
jgi:hypothetical protein